MVVETFSGIKLIYEQTREKKCTKQKILINRENKKKDNDNGRLHDGTEYTDTHVHCASYEKPWGQNKMKTIVKCSPSS